MANLESMTLEEREQYYQEVCKEIGLSPELRLLDFIWFPSGDGGRKLVLYALKGATDILRKNRGISITKLEKEILGDLIVFTAEGVDASGRKEMAIGAGTIAGLKGKELINETQRAQTRSLRRLTLQFVGCSILDESEVSETTTDISAASAPLSALAAAATPISVTPNSEAGKDVTNGASSNSVGHLTVNQDGEGSNPSAPVQTDEPKKHRRHRNEVSFDEPLSKEKEKEFRVRLGKYNNEVLPQAGMLPTEGIGGVNRKVSLFAQKMFPDMNGKMVEHQWVEFLGFMDKMLADHGAVVLVKHIHETIGIKE